MRKEILLIESSLPYLNKQTKNKTRMVMGREASRLETFSVDIL